MSRVTAVVGILAGVGTAFIASGFSNIMIYIQLLFGFFNAPVFATFIVAMFWKRCTPWAGISGLAAGTAGAAIFHFFVAPQMTYFNTPDGTPNAQMVNFYAAMAAFVADVVVTVVVSLVTQPKPVAQLAGLVWGVPDPNAPDPSTVKKVPLYESPKLLGGIALLFMLILSIIFI